MVTVFQLSKNLKNPNFCESKSFPVFKMGAGVSRVAQLSGNESINRLVSPESLPPGHPFWNSTLSFELKTPKNKSGWIELESIMDESLRRFAVNNLKSGNFGALVQIFLTRSAELESSLETNRYNFCNRFSWKHVELSISYIVSALFSSGKPSTHSLSSESASSSLQRD